MPANNDTDEIKKYEQYQKSLDSLEGDALLDAINNMAEEEVVGIDESDEYSDTDKNDVLQKISDTPVIDVDDYREINSELEQTEENAAEERSETENNMQEEKLASHENALQTLIKENVSDDDEDDEDFVVDNYHYYDTAAILKNSDISNEKLRNAEAQFFADPSKAPYISDIDTGYLQSEDDSVEPGGEAWVSAYDGSWKVRLTYMKDQIIRSYCTNCYYTRPDQASSFFHEPCVHEVAAIMLLTSYLNDKDMTDTTDHSADVFLQQALNGRASQKNLSVDAAPDAEPLHIEAHLETPRDESRIFLSFSIGSSKMYKVKSLVSLINGFRNKETQSFGKNTELTLSEDLLDEKSKNWYEFLCDEYDSFNEMRNRFRSTEDLKYGYYSAVDELKFPNTLVLDSSRWDRFFELQQGTPLDYTKRDATQNTKAELTLLDGKLDLTLKIEPLTTEENGRRIFEGVSVTSEPTRLFRGKNYFYQMTENAIIRVSGENSKITNALCDSCGENGIHLNFGRTSINTFWHSVLPELQKVANVVITEQDYIEKYIVPDPEFHFYLDEQDSVVYGQAEASYGGARFSLGEWDPQNLSPVKEGFRKRSNEEYIYQRFISYLPNYDIDHHIFFCHFDDDAMYELLDHGLRELMSLGEVQVTDNFKRLRIRNTVPMRVGVSVKSGIMDLSISSEGMSQEELENILYAYKNKSHYYRLKNGDFLKLDDNPTVDSLEQMMTELQIPLKDFVKGKMSVPAYRALYLEHMLSSMDDVYANRDSHFRALVRAFKSVEDSDYDVPAALNASLRKYQEEGYEWLRTLDQWNFGGILADEMGLGKTLQVITMILSVKENETSHYSDTEESDASAKSNDSQLTRVVGEGIDKVNPIDSVNSDIQLPVVSVNSENNSVVVDSYSTFSSNNGVAIVSEKSGTSLVVCPASLVYNWGEEIKKFAPSLNYVLITGPAADREEIISHVEEYDVAVTSYDFLRKDVNLYEDHSFRFAIADEAQNMKNYMTATAHSAKVIRAKTRFALTGTPIENRLSELWSIFDFVMPGYLYDYNTFREEIELPAIKDDDEEAMSRLRRMVTPFILRRQKKDVLKDLPEKLEEVRYAHMESKQQLLYDAEVTKMKNSLRGKSEDEFKHSKIEIFAELTRIREICCDPSLLFDNYDGESAKTEMCMELIRNLIDGGHRALIFSQFTSMLEILEEKLKAEEIPYFKIYGDTQKKKRLDMVNEFNSGDVPLFLISLKAGGTGLNLTGADVVIHFDPWWNLAAQNQATDRAHRIGQTKTVTVFRLIVKGTIEEKILELQEKKKKLSDDILGGESVSSTALDKDELLALLG